MIWVTLDPRVDLGFLPSFLQLNDPRPAKEQINARYLSGWLPTPGCSIAPGPSYALLYPGDPPLKLLAFTMLRDEFIFYYGHDYVAIVQKDGSFEVSRLP